VDQEALQTDKKMSEICYRKVLFMASVAALIPAVWGGLEPVLAHHLHSTLGNISSSTVGLLISMSALPATLVAVVVPRLTELWTDLSVVLLGLFAFAVAVASLAVNESLWIGFAPGSVTQWTIQVFGLLVCGVGWGLSWTPLLASMVDHAATRVAADQSVSHSVASTMVSSAAAALFNAAAAIGEASGPTLGGAMISVFGFDTTCCVIAVFLSIIGLLAKLCTASEEELGSPPPTPRSAGNAKQLRLCSAVGRPRTGSTASTNRETSE
jgi:MFS family permease